MSKTVRDIKILKTDLYTIQGNIACTKAMEKTIV